MKYAIVLNQELDSGTQLSALGHVAVGLAHLASRSEQAMRSFIDREGRFIGLMSDHPMIVLSGVNSAKLRQAYLCVRNAGLTCNAFVLDMKTGEPIDQERAIQTKADEDFVFVAIGAWGGPEAVRYAFNRFSLYR